MEMKKIDLTSVQSGMKRFFELFNLILEASDYDLNRFVEGNTVSIEDPSIEKYNNEFQEMLDELITISINSKSEDLFKKLEKLSETVQINKFVEWLSGYAEAAIVPYKETSFIREMTLENFATVAQYCFNNFVLVESGRENIDKTICEEKELIILRKLIFTIADLAIVNNLSKNYAYSKIVSIFGLDLNYVTILWDLIKNNEEKMYRIILMRKIYKLEQKMDRLYNEED